MIGSNHLLGETMAECCLSPVSAYGVFLPPEDRSFTPKNKRPLTFCCGRPGLGVLHSPGSTRQQPASGSQAENTNNGVVGLKQAFEQNTLPVGRKGTFAVVCDEDPWTKKHRMERAIRRKDAALRARGVPVNRAGTPSSGSTGQ